MNAQLTSPQITKLFFQKGAISYFVFHRSKKVRFVKLTLKPAANEKFCLFADVHGCKAQGTFARSKTLPHLTQTLQLHCEKKKVTCRVFSDCPVTYMQHKRSCFRFYDLSMKPADANSVCQDDGHSWGGKGHLAKLNDISKVDLVQGLLQG